MPGLAQRGFGEAFTAPVVDRHPGETIGCDARGVPTLVRPRIATLCLCLDPQGRPTESDLTLATRDGEVVWRGRTSPGAWLVGLRMRGRCTGSPQDALWLMTRALLEAELVTHGLHRDGSPDLRVDVSTGPEGTTVRTRCGVIPMAERAGVHDVPWPARVDEHVRRASREVPASVGSPSAGSGQPPAP